ncbi:glycosyltransferase [Halobacterium yunchengense]|uniref:glycosyltransferase n=1 Tax=Halobacterium yunchengense TaxID=3108497 RepID=UPI00300BD185
MPSSPVLSVIIPVYNDPDGVRQTLSSLVAQRDNPKFEIIVVDNNSTDETPQVIEEFEREHPDIVYGYEETDVQSSYAARNTGIENASGEILAFIDADVTVADTWVADISEKFENSSVDYIGCNVEMYVPDGKDTIWAQYDVTMGLPVQHYLNAKRFAPTCALAVRRNVVEQVGLFDETLVSGGDKEFGRRVHNHNFKMGYVPDIVVKHPARTSLDSLLKKASRIGQGQAQLWSRHDLATHPLSPFRLLPPSPQRIRNRTNSSQVPLPAYFLAYFLKLVQTVQAGKLYFQQIRK